MSHFILEMLKGFTVSDSLAQANVTNGLYKVLLFLIFLKIEEEKEREIHPHITVHSTKN